MSSSHPPPILAFNDPIHDSSFCMYQQTGITHVEIERFTRRKYETQNPVIGFCELCPDAVEEFPIVAIEEGYFLAPLVRRVLSNRELLNDPVMLTQQVAAARAGPGDYMPDTARSETSYSPSTAAQVQKFFRHLLKNESQIYFCGHHEAHAANAFFSSGFASALTVTLDGGGQDWLVHGRRKDQTALIYGGVYECAGASCRTVAQLTDVSFGWAWVRVTAVLGLSWGEEGTVMAMAALGDPSRFRILFEAPFFWMPNAADLDPATAEEMNTFMSSAREQVRDEQDRYDMAAALQAATEERVATYMRRFISEDVTNLCVAGGLFLNCQLLGKLRHFFPQIRNIFIPPAPYDGGISIGAAQIVLHMKLGFSRTIGATGIAPFGMGKSYSRAEITDACGSFGLIGQHVGPQQVVELLEAGQIIGLFSAASESGRRALGHRSIVADPRRLEIKDRINNEIKHRQWFRPLAPMALAEHAWEWFECGTEFISPYMSFAVPVRPQLRERVPAILHLDGTARVQTVHRELSPLIHELLSKWHASTGVPMLVNTSFNDREPIVETPVDALNTFQRVPLDALYFIDVGLMVSKTHMARVAN